MPVGTEMSWQSRIHKYPQVRYMGSKVRLLPWIESCLKGYEFSSVLDAFSGAGSVSYLFKALGKKVLTNDFLHFPATLAAALIENSSETINDTTLEFLMEEDPAADNFIQRTFSGIFYTIEDLGFLDSISYRIRQMSNPAQRALALAALLRSCAKRQPRGVFTVADPSRYHDGRRDLSMSLREHFAEQVPLYNAAVFDNTNACKTFHGDVFALPTEALDVDLVYLDPPYVPRSDDNCYVKRYHFLEGLSRYWESMDILQSSKVRKIAKPYTPFSYRKDAGAAFDRMFAQFRNSTIVLSYSSNGYPDLDELIRLMSIYKKNVSVCTKEHRYHFGTHANVARTKVDEYLIIGVS